MAKSRLFAVHMLKDEWFFELTDMEARLWIGLILLSDDYGNLCCLPAYLKINIPSPNNWSIEAIQEILIKWQRQGVLQCYRNKAKLYCHLVNWERYQYIQRPAKTTIPYPEDCILLTDLTSDDFLENLRNSEKKLENIRKDKKLQEKNSRPPTTTYIDMDMDIDMGIDTSKDKHIDTSKDKHIDTSKDKHIDTSKDKIPKEVLEFNQYYKSLKYYNMIEEREYNMQGGWNDYETQVLVQELGRKSRWKHLQALLKQEVWSNNWKEILDCLAKDKWWTGQDNSKEHKSFTGDMDLIIRKPHLAVKIWERLKNV